MKMRNVLLAIAVVTVAVLSSYALKKHNNYSKLPDMQSVRR